jgi:hypothetical protein
MTRSIFDREVFFTMEKLGNPFVAARALSLRAREVNARHREEAETICAPAIALEDYLEGRIAFTQGNNERFRSE